MDPQPPPPPPYAPQPPQQPGPWGTGTPPPQVPYTPMPQQQPPARSSGGIVRSIVATVVVVGLIAGAYFLYRAVTNTADVASLAVGDCIDLPANDTNITDVQKQPCTNPHDAEVFLNLTDPAGGDAPYPGQSHFQDLATSQCLPAASAYLGVDFDQRQDLDAGYLYPTTDSWEDHDDRGLTCYMYKLDETKLTAPLKNSGAQPT